jgi:hypothetical protein
MCPRRDTLCLQIDIFFRATSIPIGAARRGEYERKTAGLEVNEKDLGANSFKDSSL